MTKPTQSKRDDPEANARRMKAIVARRAKLVHDALVARNDPHAPDPAIPGHPPRLFVPFEEMTIEEARSAVAALQRIMRNRYVNGWLDKRTGNPIVAEAVRIERRQFDCGTQHMFTPPAPSKPS